MLKSNTFDFDNLILSLSEALDIASPKLSHHQIRTAYIAVEIGKTANLSDELIEDIFIASLLHDIGALKFEEKISLHEFEDVQVSPHCTIGERLLKQIPWLSNAARIVKFHHQGWSEWDEAIDEPVVLGSQIVGLADYLERKINRNKFILHQTQELISEITHFSGTSFHPHVVEMFIEASKREEFWLDLDTHRIYSLLLHFGPHKQVEYNYDNLLLISELIRNIIDFRSRYTSTHSVGVATSAQAIATIFGLTKRETELIRIAGNLHDVGKLVVPNSILEKPGKLTKDEFAVIRSHPYFTRSVLSGIKGLDDITKWASFHHEKLNGSGYPFRKKEEEICTASRIISVSDVFTALTEDRPYRKRMERKDVVKILKELSDSNQIDKNIVQLLIENYDEVLSLVLEKQIVVGEFYESQFREVLFNIDIP